MEVKDDNLRLYLITDDVGRPGLELARIVSEAIEGGVTAVQFREKSLAGEECESALKLVSQVCRTAGVPLFLNADLARDEWAGYADGVHYGSRTREPFAASDGVKGYSAHSLTEAQDAVREGALFVTISPIFETPSKRGLLPVLGPHYISALRAALGKASIIALGGIDETNAEDCVRAGGYWHCGDTSDYVRPGSQGFREGFAQGDETLGAVYHGTWHTSQWFPGMPMCRLSVPDVCRMQGPCIRHTSGTLSLHMGVPGANH